MSERVLEAASGLRGLLEDLLTPSLGRLEVKVESLGERCDRMASEIQEVWQAHQALLSYVGEQLTILNSRLGRLEGRSEGLKSELTAVLQLEILKASQRVAPVLLPAPEPGSE